MELPALNESVAGVLSLDVMREMDLVGDPAPLQEDEAEIDTNELSARLYHELYHLSLTKKLRAVLVLFCLIVVPSIIAFLVCYFKAKYVRQPREVLVGDDDKPTPHTKTVLRQNSRFPVHSAWSNARSDEAIFAVKESRLLSKPNIIKTGSPSSLEPDQTIADQRLLSFSQQDKLNLGEKRNCGRNVKVTLTDT